MFIFLDESGDLGSDLSKQNSSRYFIVTALVCDDNAVVKEFKIAVKRTLKNKYNYLKNKNNSNELKGSLSPLSVKEYFWRHSPKTNWKIYSLIINKETLAGRYKSPKAKRQLYDSAVLEVLERINFYEASNKINIIFDKCKLSSEIEEFNNYIKSYLSYDASLYISHEMSNNNIGLQAVDMFCNGIYQKYSNNSLDWYSLFRDYIVVEKLL